MGAIPRVGDPAPDFELDGTDGRFRLADHRGRRVVLLFYPRDRGVVCVRQFGSYARDRDRLDRLDATVVGVSAQPVASHATFRRQLGIPFPLLSDVDLAVTRAYRVAEPVFGTRRAVVVIDADGIIRHRYVHALGVSYVPAHELVQVLADIR